MDSTLQKAASAFELPELGPEMGARCSRCNEPITPRHVQVFGGECHQCRIRRLAVADIRRLAERVIRGADPSTLEDAVGRLMDLCLERGI